jgi:hypothetical protein
MIADCVHQRICVYHLDAVRYGQQSARLVCALTFDRICKVATVLIGNAVVGATV